MHSRTGIRIVPASASDWGGAFVASLVVPGGEEADAATLTTDALSDTARDSNVQRSRPPQKIPEPTRRRFSVPLGLRRRVISPSLTCTGILRAWRASTSHPTQAQAENLGAQYAKIGLGEQTLTSGRISTDLLNQFGSRSRLQARARAFFLRSDLLPNIFGVTIEGPLP